MQRPLRTTSLLLVAGGLALTACGDDGNDQTAEVAAPADDSVVEVVMYDYGFKGLPDEVDAGTRIAVSNESGAEIHEFVAFRLADDETRSAADILAGDLGPILGGGEPAAVLLAAPGGEQINAVGDGVLTEPGRYLILCFIPTGADPEEFLAAAATSDGPPQVDGGPPHAMQGMFAELVVNA